MRIALLVALLTVSLLVEAKCPTYRYTITGEVKDEARRAVGGAKVEAQWLEWRGLTSVSTLTDASGKYHLVVLFDPLSVDERHFDLCEIQLGSVRVRASTEKPESGTKVVILQGDSTVVNLVVLKR